MEHCAATHVRPIERDKQVPGLHIKHGTRGSAWYLYYRTKEGLERRPKLGSTEVLNRTQARDQARAILRQAAAGEDPKKQLDLAKAYTIEDLRNEYDRLHASIEVKASTRRAEGYIWDKHIIPFFGRNKPVRSITKQEIIAIKGKMRKTPTQANRTLALLSHSLNLSEDWGWRDEQTNPVYRVKRYKEKARQRLPDASEARRLLTVLRSWREEEPYFVSLVLLLIFTGCRRGEVMNSRRSWWYSDRLVLPDSKTGQKVIPISTHAWDVVLATPEMKGNPYLIVGRKEKSHIKDPRKLWARLLKESGIDNLNMHDLRRLFASTSVSSGISLEQTMQLMGHTQAQTTKRYAFLMTPEKIAAMQATGDALAMIEKKPLPE
jgi:hypothetical protein